ncbi:SDR family NAD(P)-dependent oxidoreductase [Agromyces aurantiacus]|uniref:SDR family NAD(P)-dependent oxidoreductase n=1 Tax=Agromyces aurantiacus TaxID=165814 RepID=A0ABV9R589_9MICO|nr:SDR family NAD(P)-dependent oxidoreductase [Agromyces aurantiacus]MBM7503307.1 NAD(P)-dependent dehydrogenase (short-subunit alcohol dehydrogenase family) [Agromyces aurantiacus]
MTTDHSLDARTILITGARRGLGRALLEEALDRGAARVYAGVRTPFEHADPRVTPLLLDVADPLSIEHAAAQVPVLDLLINNAAMGGYDDLTDGRVLSEHLTANVLGPLTLTNALARALAARGGAVVNVGSLAALANLPVMPSYSISKAALFSLSQAQRALFARRGVRVHAVLSGPIDTDMTRDLAIPKTAPAQVAASIFDGVLRDAEEIFPDGFSARFEDGWNEGALKAFERANAALLPQADDPLTLDLARAADA